MQHKHNVKKLWQTLNLVIGKTNDKTSLPDSVSINGQSEKMLSK